MDRRKDTDIMAMFKPSGWATCSTPQWEGGIACFKKIKNSAFLQETNIFGCLNLCFPSLFSSGFACKRAPKNPVLFRVKSFIFRHTFQYHLKLVKITLVYPTNLSFQSKPGDTMEIQRTVQASRLLMWYPTTAIEHFQDTHVRCSP